MALGIEVGFADALGVEVGRGVALGVADGVDVGRGVALGVAVEVTGAVENVVLDLTVAVESTFNTEAITICIPVVATPFAFGSIVGFGVDIGVGVGVGVAVTEGFGVGVGVGVVT